MFGTPLDRSREAINVHKFNIDLSPIEAKRTNLHM